VTDGNWERGLMTVGETAHVLRVPVSWVYERTRRRGKDRLPHIKLGKYLRFEPAAIHDWLKGMKQS
jgi:excisionase family DNA binding protein